MYDIHFLKLYLNSADAYCIEENDCKFWTYQVKNGNCFLKTSDANRKSDKNGAISGSSGCSTGKGGSINDVQI